MIDIRFNILLSRHYSHPNDSHAGICKLEVRRVFQALTAASSHHRVITSLACCCSCANAPMTRKIVLLQCCLCALNRKLKKKKYIMSVLSCASPVSPLYLLLMLLATVLCVCLSRCIPIGWSAGRDCTGSDKPSHFAQFDSSTFLTLLEVCQSLSLVA